MISKDDGQAYKTNKTRQSLSISFFKWLFTLCWLYTGWLNGGQVSAMDKCKGCLWGKDVGGKIFCLWPRCVKSSRKS